MKKVSVLMATFIMSAVAYAQTWTMDKAHSKLGFTVTHLMVNDVDGMFKTFDATLTSSKPDFSDAQFTMTGQTNSIFTDNDMRDGDLKSPNFFDAANDPTITFQSKSMKKVGDRKYKMTGELTMHGITKTVVLDVSYKGPTIHPMTHKPDVGFKITGKVKRSDFKIGEKYPNAMISEEVVITANGEFSQG